MTSPPAAQMYVATSPQPASPSAVVASPVSQGGGGQLMPSGSPSSGFEVAQSSPVSSGAKQPKLCFCIEPDANLTPQERAKKQKWALPTMIIAGIASFVLLILAIVALVKIVNFSGAYTDILDTWNTKPVYDVQFVTINPANNGAASCPAGYSFTAGEWGGTFPACTCFGSLSSNSTDTVGCTYELENAGCIDRDGIPSVSLSIASSLGMCVRRGGLTALQRPDASSSSASCPPNTMQCGTRADNYFCTPIDSTGVPAGRCPLTDMLMTTSDVDVTPWGARIEKTSVGIIDGQLHYMYVARGGAIPEDVLPQASRSGLLPLSLNVSTYPITDLELLSGRPCLISSSCYYSGRDGEYAAQESAARTSGVMQAARLGYTLRDSACSGCTKPPSVPGGSVSPKGEDIRFLTVISREERQVYADSGVRSDFTTSSSTYKFSLNARSEVAWASSCKRTRQDINGQRNNVSHVKNFQIVLLVISILTFIVFSIVIPCLEYKTKGRWTDERRNWYGKQCLNVFFKAFVVSFTIATMVIALAVLSYWVEVDGSTPDAQCSDPLSTEVFKILSEDYKGLSYSNVGSMVTMGFTGFLDGIVKLFTSCAR